MNPRDIENALRAVLANANILPVGWANTTAPTTRPHLLAYSVRLEPRDDTLQRTSPRQRGRFIVTHIGNVGVHTGNYDDQATQVAELYPAGLLIPFEGGTIEITDHPHVKDGYREGNDWRTQVVIPYEALPSA